MIASYGATDVGLRRKLNDIGGLSDQCPGSLLMNSIRSDAGSLTYYKKFPSWSLPQKADVLYDNTESSILLYASLFSASSCLTRACVPFRSFNRAGQCLKRPAVF